MTTLHELAVDFARESAGYVRGSVGPDLLARHTAAIDANLAPPSELRSVASMR